MHIIKKKKKKVPTSFGRPTDNANTLYKHKNRIDQQTIVGLNSTELIYHKKTKMVCTMHTKHTYIQYVGTLCRALENKGYIILTDRL